MCLGIGELNQVVGHSVVMSFIHSNRHPEQNSLIPALGISGKDRTIIASLYDCHMDILFHLHPVLWLNEDGTFTESVVVLLWLLLHHKLFLCKLIDSCISYKSGLIDLFKNTNVLHTYQALNDYNIFGWLNKQIPQDGKEIEFKPCVKRIKHV